MSRARWGTDRLDVRGVLWGGRDDAVRCREGSVCTDSAPKKCRVVNAQQHTF